LDDLVIKGGAAYETPTTLQPCRKRICGDGTVPYQSLNYCESWADIENAPKMEISGIVPD
jgi:hypothetical protein